MNNQYRQEEYDDVPVKLMLYPSLFFMITGMILGVFIAFNAFVIPDYFAGEYIHFGKLRPIHVGSVLFLWLLSANLGLLFYFVQRLCGVGLWSPLMGRIACYIWWFTLFLQVHSYPFGTNYGWEYAELPNWIGYIPAKPLLFLSWILITINLFMTIFRRKYEKMYVSLWYTMGTLIWTSITLFVGLYSLEFLPGGISRVNASFFYVHNLVGLVFTPMGLAIVYYYLPKLANVPIYSHKLSMIGFWAIAFFYAWIGAHHIIHGPMSQWLQTVSIVFSIWLFIPVWTVVYNVIATLKPQWKQYSQSAPIRFIMMGTVFYLVTCIQGPLMALRNVNEITSKTDWIIGHSHISLFATFSFFAFAGIYYTVPRIVKKPLWSERMADWHFTLNLFGSVPFILSLWIGGYIQGLLWASWADGATYLQYQQNLSRMTFLDTIGEMHIWWILRLLGGVIVLFANIIFTINMYNTIMLEKREEEPIRATS